MSVWWGGGFVLYVPRQQLTTMWHYHFPHVESQLTLFGQVCPPLSSLDIRRPPVTRATPKRECIYRVDEAVARADTVRGDMLNAKARDSARLEGGVGADWWELSRF